MNSPLSSKFLTAILAGLLLLLTANICQAQTFTLNLPDRTAPKLPVAKVKITLDLQNAPVTGTDSLDVPGGTRPLTNLPTPASIFPPGAVTANRVFFYKGVGNSVVIEIELRSLLKATTLCEPLPPPPPPAPPPFPTTLSLTANLNGNTINGYRLNSYSALSTNQCSCLRRRLDDPGAEWGTLPPGMDRGRHPLDVVLVLDHSGSMGDPVPSGLIGSSGEVKMLVLQTAVKQFIEEWKMEPSAPPDDRLAITWFDTNISFNPSPRGFIRRSANNWDSLKTAVDLKMPGLDTAMGDGLSEGVDLYEDMPENDVTYVLMTDGIQNVGNLIQPANCDVTVLCEFNHLNAPMGFQPIKEICAPVLTIGIGPPTSVQTNMLTGISQQTAGVNYQAVNAVEVANSFGNTLVQTLKGNTMSVHTQTEGTLNAGSPSVSPAATFKLDDSVARALVVLGWTGAGNSNALRLELIKPGGGAPLVLGAQANDPFFTIQAIDIPASGLTGDWQASVVRNVGSGSVPYYISIYTFEAKFGSRLDFKQISHGTGDDITLTAALNFGNQPLLNQGNGLQVQIERPETALNTALHNLNVSTQVLTTPPPGVSPDSYTTPYERKLFNLLQTTSLGKDIEPKPDPILLRLLDNGNPDNGDAVAGDGVYSVRYAGTKTRVPGRYRFKVKMNLTTPTSQPINRIEQRDTQVLVLKVDTAQSEINATRDLITGNYRIDIVPADRFGNFLGPGYASLIKVSLTGGGTVVGSIVDERQNGTYTINVNGVAPGTNPTLKVTYNGDEFGNITLKDAQKPKRRYAFFAGIGGNFPHGDFNTVFDSGVSGHLGFEYLFTNRVSVEGTFGYERFNLNFFPTHLNLYRGSGNLKFYPVIGTFQFGILGGGGVYRFDPGDTRGGLNIGAVGEVRLNTSVSIESTYNFHTVFTPGTNVHYSTLQGGIRFRF